MINICLSPPYDDELIEKAKKPVEVKGHTRATKTGKVTQVRAYQEHREAAAGADTGVTLDILRSTLNEFGLTVQEVSSVPEAARTAMKMTEPKAYTQEQRMAARGIGDAFHALKDNVMLGKLRGAVKNIPVVFACYEPTMAAMSYLHGGGYAALLVNTAYENAEAVADPARAQSFAAREAAHAVQASGSIDEGITTLYRISTWHEYGHMLDTLLGGDLTNALIDNLMLQFGTKMAAISKWVTTHISLYAMASPNDTTAEAFSMYMGRKAPKELTPWLELAGLTHPS